MTDKSMLTYQHCIELEEEEQKSLLRQYGPGHVHVNKCALCGLCEFSSTRLGKPDKVSVEITSSAGCRRCVEIMQRAPEVFRWMGNVATHLEMRLVKALHALEDKIPKLDADPLISNVRDALMSNRFEDAHALVDEMANTAPKPDANGCRDTGWTLEPDELKF